jgi:hypothetical protein
MTGIHPGLYRFHYDLPISFYILKNDFYTDQYGKYLHYLTCSQYLLAGGRKGGGPVFGIVAVVGRDSR